MEMLLTREHAGGRAGLLMANVTRGWWHHTGEALARALRWVPSSPMALLQLPPALVSPLGEVCWDHKAGKQ